MMFHREAGTLDRVVAEMNHSMPFYYRVADNQGMGAEQIMEAEALFNRGRFVDAHIMLERARVSAAGEEQHYILMCCDFLDLRLSCCGKMPWQENWYEERLERFKRLHDPLLFTVLDGCAAYVYALLGQNEKIPAWIREGKLAEANLLNPARPMYDIIYNQVLLLQKQYAKVLGRGDALLAACRGIHYLLCEIHLHIQLAIANEALGRSVEATAALKQALDLALPDGILMPFVENRQQLLPLMKLLPAQYDEGVCQILAICETMESSQSATQSLWDSLTEREKTVAALYGSGKNRKDIAETLFLSEGTVKNYISTVYEKLHLSGSPKQKHHVLSQIVDENHKKR